MTEILNAGRTFALAAALAGSLTMLSTTETHADDETGLYGQLGATYNIARKSRGTSLDKGLGFNAAVGYDFGGFRFDTGLNYVGGLKLGATSRSVGGGTAATRPATVRSLRWMNNVSVDFGSSGISPYVTAGIGLARNTVKAAPGTFTSAAASQPFTTSRARSTNFAWQIGGGVTVPVTQSIKLDVGYRYVDSGRIKTGNISGAGLTLAADSTKRRLRSHEVSAGVRVLF